MAPNSLALQVIAELLRTTGQLTEQIGTELCSDPYLAGKYTALLQDIDLLSQRQVALAAVLASDNLEASLADCKLEWVKSALSQKMMHQQSAAADRAIAC